VPTASRSTLGAVRIRTRQLGIGCGEAGCSIRPSASADAVLRLHRLMNLSKREEMCKFSAPVRSSKITQFQQLGQRMQLENDGWVSNQSGVDPSGSGDIISVVGAASENGYDQATVDVLRKVRAPPQASHQSHQLDSSES
jgi:hypothetical protein